jgi:hypothetical protein
VWYYFIFIKFFNMKPAFLFLALTWWAGTSEAQSAPEKVIRLEVQQNGQPTKKIELKGSELDNPETIAMLKKEYDLDLNNLEPTLGNKPNIEEKKIIIRKEMNWQQQARVNFGLSIIDQPNFKGVLVSNLTENGLSARSGLKKGDVVNAFKINDEIKDVTNVAQLKREMQRLNEMESIVLLVNRHGKNMEIKITVPRQMNEETF